MSRAALQDVEKLIARKLELALLGASPKLESRLRELRRWQAARLTRTYGDLREDPRCAPAVEFFLTDLYSESDFAARDHDLMRAWGYLKRSLPETPLQALARAIELEVLTAELDHAMVAALAPGELTAARYAQAYRAVDRRDARQRQIDLVIGIGQDLERAARRAWVGALLVAAHAPAHAAGFHVLQDFLERGYDAFRRMGSAGKLLDAIRERETSLMNALFAGADAALAPAAGAGK